MCASVQVPGMLLIAGDDLHFVQTHARVSAADYLGIRALKVRKASASKAAIETACLWLHAAPCLELLQIVHVSAQQASARAAGISTSSAPKFSVVELQAGDVGRLQSGADGGSGGASGGSDSDAEAVVAGGPGGRGGGVLSG